MIDYKSVVWRTVIGIVAIAVFYFLCWDYLSNGTGIDDIGKQLDTAREQQQRAGFYIDRATTGIEQVEDGISKAVRDADSITKRLDKLQTQSLNGSELITDSSSRIRQCLEVIGKAKERSTKD